MTLYTNDGPEFGTYAAIPAPGVIGRRYVASDGRIEFLDDGTLWRPLIGGVIGTSPPTIAAGGWGTFGTGAVTYADATGTITGTNPGNIASDNLTGLDVAKVTTNTTVLHFLPVGFDVSLGKYFTFAGIAVRDSGTGKLTVFGTAVEDENPPSGTFVSVLDYTNPTTFSAGALDTLYGGVGLAGVWLRFRDDGTNHLFDVSPNGVDWLNVLTRARAAFLAAGGNRVGLCIDTVSAQLVQFDSWTSAP